MSGPSKLPEIEGSNTKSKNELVEEKTEREDVHATVTHMDLVVPIASDETPFSRDVERHESQETIVQTSEVLQKEKKPTDVMGTQPKAKRATRKKKVDIATFATGDEESAPKPDLFSEIQRMHETLRERDAGFKNQFESLHDLIKKVGSAAPLQGNQIVLPGMHNQAVPSVSQPNQVDYLPMQSEPSSLPTGSGLPYKRGAYTTPSDEREQQMMGNRYNRAFSSHSFNNDYTQKRARLDGIASSEQPTLRTHVMF